MAELVGLLITYDLHLHKMKERGSRIAFKAKDVDEEKKNSSTAHSKINFISEEN